MIHSYNIEEGRLTYRAGLAPGALWLDLEEPTADERASVAEALGFEIPSLADQQEIEHSSRLYLEDMTPVMTAVLPARNDAGQVHFGPVTFIVTRERLITVRHHAPGPFRTFPEQPHRATLPVAGPMTVLGGLLEAVVDRLADVVEATGRDIEAMTHKCFHTGEVVTAPVDHTALLREIGRTDAFVMQLRESLMTVDRVLGFLQSNLGMRKPDEMRKTLKSAQRDIRTIVEQADFLTQKTSLLLDATLGMIDIEQNHIGKIFSIVATVFLPPTLIASIFGMNFAWMPILEWRYGLHLCIALMLVSAALPLLWFKRKGWL